MNQVIRAIDTGYGNIKYVTEHNNNSIMRCASFPSWAIPARNNRLSGGCVKSRDTVTIDVSGQAFEVGPDIERALDRHLAKPLHAQFVKSNEYIALTLGALYYITEPKIDTLVVGLPVHLTHTYADLLVTRITGQHRIADRIVTIENVIVVAQPLGGFVDFALSRGLYGVMREQTILIVDPGYYTVDWLITTGMNIHDGRSSSFEGGVHSILKAVAEKISSDHKINFTQLPKLDNAIQKNRLSIAGKNIDLAHYLHSAEPYTQRAINALREHVGDGSDIDQIMLVGGGAHLFESAIRDQFPGRLIHRVDNALYANVRGFQRIGEHAVKALSAKTAA